MIVLGPCRHMWILFQQITFRRLPCAVKHAMADMGALGDIARLACEPRRHVRGRTNLLAWIENGDNPFGLLQLDEAPQMLNDLGHVHHVYDTLAQRVRVEQWRIDDDCPGMKVVLDQPDDLPQQSVLGPLILPGCLHQLVYFTGRLEDDALHP